MYQLLWFSQCISIADFRHSINSGLEQCDVIFSVHEHFDQTSYPSRSRDHGQRASHGHSRQILSL